MLISINKKSIRNSVRALPGTRIPVLEIRTLTLYSHTLIQSKAYCPEIRIYEVCLITLKTLPNHSLDFILFYTEIFFMLVQVVLDM